MKTYTVQTGDSFFLIAQKFYGNGHTYTLLAAYNNILDPNALEVGQVLNIPSIEQLQQSAQQALRIWHNYGSGSIYWRVTERGVEIQGKGILKKTTSTQQAKRIWNTYQQPILAASQKHGVSVPTIIATIATESSGNPKAYRYEPAFYERYLKDKSPWTESPYYSESERISASYGLMQIMYTTAYNAGFRGQPEDLYDPATAIDISTAYIASAFQRKQHQWDPPKIACAYNAGSVRPTRKNAWGMFYHPGHLDRWIPAYNGAIDVIGPEHVAESPLATPEPVVVSQPQPSPVTVPDGPQAAPHATLHLIFPKPATGSWSPVIVDLFRHTDQGMANPVSVTITSPTVTANKEYTHNIQNLSPGKYDLVFADMVSSSILYDVADYEMSAPQSTLDLRQNLHTDSSPPLPDHVTVIFKFSSPSGRAWRPMIVDVCQHTKSGHIEEPVSHTVKIPSHAPDGGYLYKISHLEPGVYDFVFTDAATSSVLQDIADYVVDDNPEIIDLRNTRSLYPPSEHLPEQEQERMLTRLWHSFLSLFSGK